MEVLGSGKLRRKQLLNCGWKFVYGYREPDEIQDKEEWSDIGLPHSFGIPYFMENEFYVGYGCYYRELDISEEDLRKRIYLEFLGVFQCAEIYLNEEFVGKHEGGYTSFVVDLTERCRAGKNELLVRVNNNWNARLAPRAGEHQFNGGIYRDVFLVLTERTCVEWMGTFVQTEKLEENTALISAEVTVYSENKIQNGYIINRIFQGEKELLSFDKILEEAKEQTVLTKFKIENPLLWSPENPDLYKMVSEIFLNGEKTDEYSTIFGIRTVRFDKDTGFYLNGKPYKIWGANVHQDHAGWADAVTRSGITRDIQMIKDCGMNFIRGSHYPHHPFFAEECDRIGILFWSELCFWGTGGPKEEGYWTSSAYPIHEEDQEPFEKSCLRALEEMILINRNNPSVIIWSVSNEPFFTDKTVLNQTKNLVKKLVNRVHELDPSRKAAVGGAQREGFDVLGDVAGYNGDGASLYIDPGFPSFVSEYGSMYGYRPGTFNPNFRDGVEKDYPWRSGKALWCAFHHGSILGGMGAMGMIDYYRLPLNTWYWYRKELLGIPAPEIAKKGIADHLELHGDRTEFLANGQEDVWLHVYLCNKEGKRISNELPVTLEVVEGDGIFPTGRSITFKPEDNSFLDGQAAIEFRSYFGGENVIEARADGLEPVRLCLKAKGEPCSRQQVPMVHPPYLTPAPKMETVYELSENRPVFASSSKKGHEPYCVVNSAEQYWVPQEEDEAWIELDLEGEKEFTTIEVSLKGKHQPKEITIYLSSDSENYTPCTMEWNEPIFLYTKRRKARFLRLYWQEWMEGVHLLRVWAIR